MGTGHPFTTSYDEPTRDDGWTQRSRRQVKSPGYRRASFQTSSQVTRLQLERDLALRCVDELHDYYKKELQKKDDADRRTTLMGMEQIREAQKETALQEEIRERNVIS